MMQYLNHFFGPLHLCAFLYLTVLHEQQRSFYSDYSKFLAIVHVLCGSVQNHLLLISEKTKCCHLFSLRSCQPLVYSLLGKELTGWQGPESGGEWS